MQLDAVPEVAERDLQKALDLLNGQKLRQLNARLNAKGSVLLFFFIPIEDLPELDEFTGRPEPSNPVEFFLPLHERLARLEEQLDVNDEIEAFMRMFEEMAAAGGPEEAEEEQA